MMQNSVKILSLLAAIGLSSQVLLAEDEDDNKGEDNVVTVVSQKRVQDEVTVPISVTSIGAEDLQFGGANDLNDLSDMAINFSTSGQEGYQSAIYMRGVGTWSRNIGFDTRVGVYLDGVYLGQSSALNQAMMGLEQAEVVRGPQGTLFGKNTVAGAVNLLSIKPDTSGFEGRVGLEVGNYNYNQLSGRMNLPLGENTAVQISAQKTVKDGEYNNLYNLLDSSVKSRVGDRDYEALRLQLTHEFSDNFELYFSYDDSKMEGEWLNGEALTNTFGWSSPADDPFVGFAAFSTDFVFDPGLGTFVPSPAYGQGAYLLSLFDRVADDYVIMTNQVPENNYDNNGTNLTLTYTTDNDATFRSITAMRESGSQFISDTDYSLFDFLYVDFRDNYDTTTQEFQYISPDNDEFEYLVGLYYYKQDGSTERDAIPGQAIAYLNPLFGLPCPAGVDVDITNPFTYCLEPNKNVFNRGSVDVSSWATYFNMSYAIGDSTYIDFGLRYTDETKTADYSLGTENGGVNGIIFGVANGSVVDEFSDSFLSHNIGIRMQSGETNYYAKWSTGFKSGGYNLDFIDQFALSQKARFEKETVDSYEIGMKGRYLDNNLKFTAALFYTDYEDYQVNQFLPLGDNASTISIRNVPQAISQGLELGFQYRIDDNYTLDLNYGYLDATFGEFPGGGERQPDGSNASATGNQLPYAPEHSISGGITYESDFNDDAIFIANLSWTYNSDQYTNTWQISDYTVYYPPGLSAAFPLPAPYGNGLTDFDATSFEFGLIEAHTILNLRTGFIGTGGDWDAFLWVKNLTDEQYLQDSFRDFFNTYTEQHADQMMYGFEMNYYF